MAVGEVGAGALALAVEVVEDALTLAIVEGALAVTVVVGVLKLALLATVVVMFLVKLSSISIADRKLTSSSSKSLSGSFLRSLTVYGLTTEMAGNSGL